ncbi:Uncharacterised protein [Bordetella pertussis]|nr:Uncharacterised protein [Bordetella pertussis]
MAGWSAGTEEIAWCRCGSNLSPWAGAISLSRLRSKAAVSCLSVTSTPSRQACAAWSGWARAASRLSLTGTRLSANDSMPNLRALATSSWARRRTFSASAAARSTCSC